MKRMTICCGVVAIFFVACGKSSEHAGPARSAVPVVTAVAELRDLPLTKIAIGTVAASELVTIHPQVTAVLTSVKFTEGNVISAGSPMFFLDDRPFSAAVNQADAEVQRSRAAEQQAVAMKERDQAQLAVAESDADRIATLQREGIATAQQADQAQATLRSAQATIAADEAGIATARAVTASGEATLARARLEMSWCTINAPIDGRTSALGITPGNNTTAGQTVLATIVRIQPIHIGFALPADLLPLIRAAQAQGSLAVSVRGEDGVSAEVGTLDLVDNQIDAVTATIGLRAICANAQERLWPGQQCQVEVTLGADDQVVTIPERAIQVGQQGSMVWVVAADRSVSAHQVMVKRTTAGVAIIASGINAGDTVVVDGQLRLSKGATISTADSDAKKSH